MKTVIVLNHDQFGHGDRVLGMKLLGAFLSKIPTMREVTGIVLYNSGVKLIARGSPVLGVLDQLHRDGVELWACGTCLEHYGLEPEIVPASNMDEIVGELDRAEKVMTL